MNRDKLLKLLNLLNGAEIASLDYNELKDTKYVGLPDRKTKPNKISLKENEVEVFNVDIPTLILIDECAQALECSVEEVWEYLNYHKGIMLQKNGVLRKYNFQTLVESGKKGRTVYLGSQALKVLMEKKGLDTKGFFVDKIPVLKKFIEEKQEPHCLEDECNYNTYRVILRNGRRNFFMEKNPPILVIYNESKLLEKAVREYFNYLEENGIIE